MSGLSDATQNLKNVNLLDLLKGILYLDKVQWKPFAIIMVSILPLFLLGLWWSSWNEYPFGNHDAGFHYAKALGDKSIYDKYFEGLSPYLYYIHYPPASEFITASLMRLVPFALPDYIKYDIAIFSILIGLYLLFHYYYRNDLALLFFCFSPFALAFLSTIARLILLMLILIIVNEVNVKKKHLAAYTGFLVHNKWVVLVAILAYILFPLPVWVSSLAQFVVIGVLAYGLITLMHNLVYVPLMVGLLAWDKLKEGEHAALLAGALGFLFIDTTAIFITAPFLALGSAKLYEQSPSWFKSFFLFIVLAIFAIDFVLLALGFAATPISVMSQIVLGRAGFTN